MSFVPKSFFGFYSRSNLTRPSPVLALFLFFSVTSYFLLGGDRTASAKDALGLKSKPHFPLRIGALLPKNGALADYGTQTVLGFEYAKKKLKEIYPNASLFIQDTKSTPQGAAEAANKLLGDKVHVLVGELATANTQAAATIAKSAKIPLMSIGTTLTELSDDNPFALAICIKDNFQGKILAEFALKHPIQAKTAYVLVDQDSTYSKELGKHFSQSFSKGGGQVLKTLPFGQNLRDFKSVVSKMRRKQADVIFIPAYHQQVAPLLREIRLQKISSKILGSDSWDSPGLLSTAQKAAEGAFYSSHFAIDSKEPTSVAFQTDFQKAMGTPPTTYSVMTFDAIMMAAHAALASRAPSDILGTLKSGFSYDGVSGPIRFDSKGHVKKSVFIMSIQNAKPQLLAKIGDFVMNPSSQPTPLLRIKK